MSIQKGSLVLIKIGDGNVTETFSTIGGLRASRIVLNNQVVQSDTLTSGIWRQALPNAGVRTLTISGSGIFSDAASEEMLRGYAFGGTVNNYRFIFANGDYIAGPFIITSYERGGNQDSEETYSITLASAGTLAFTNG
jgi:TP901-1 family phage major tail protein